MLPNKGEDVGIHRRAEEPHRAVAHAVVASIGMFAARRGRNRPLFINGLVDDVGGCIKAGREQRRVSAMAQPSWLVAKGRKAGDPAEGRNCLGWL